MAEFVEIVHPDLPGQVGRVPVRALHVFEGKGWHRQSDEAPAEEEASQEAEADPDEEEAI